MEVSAGDERLKKRSLLDFTALQRPFFAAIFLMVSGLARAQDSGVLLGRVLDSGGQPVAESRIDLTSSDGGTRLVARTTADGSFALCGIPAGSYGIRIDRAGFSPASRQGLVFEPSSVLCVKISLAKEGTAPGRVPSLVRIDLSDVSSRTVIDAFQVQSLPSANNIWSLIENQDFSATTNRIDVGGVWASLPALWSSRGSVSWTQSSYLVNGLEADDPYVTGTPLFYPDLESLQYLSHSNGRHPIAYLSPGGALDLVPKQGTAGYHGALSAFFSSPAMTSSLVPSRLQEEGLTERTRLNSFENYNAQFSGPIFTEKLQVFASLSRLHLNRDIADFSPDDMGTVSSALVNLTYRSDRSSLYILWTGQTIHHPTAGAARNVPHSATLDQKNLYNLFQLVWRIRLRPDHHFELAAAFNRGNIHSRFQDGVTAPHGEEIFRKIPSGAAASAGRDDRTTAFLQGKGQFCLGSLSRVHQRVDYGLSLRLADSSSEQEILGNIHLHYFGKEPFEIVRFNTPMRHNERSLEVRLFAEDHITFSNLASLSFGFQLVSTRGWVPRTGALSDFFSPPNEKGGKIDWLNVAPRLGFSLPLSNNKSLTLRVSAGRYYFNLPLRYMSYGNPQALGGLAYPWADLNHDGKFQTGEEGYPWRREGPFYAEIDPKLKRPCTDEYCVSLTRVFGENLYLTLAGFYRETRHLVETVNIGVPLTSYNPVQVYDPGDDTIPGNHDDFDFTVYNQDAKTLGEDFFLLSNPDDKNRVSRYRGLDLTLTKKFGATILFFAGTATEAIGTASPGNTEYENDDGVIGSLYDNPNSLIFAKGHLRFDRAYTARLGVSLPLFLGFRLAALLKYYDGQPFTRKIIITGFNQGPFYVQAFPRAVARYEFNMTVDLRLEKGIAVGKTRARVFLDAYNIFNWAQATEENEWTGPEFTLRYATEVQSPRVLRVGVRYEF